MVRILFFYASYTVSLCDFVHRAPNAVVANPTCCSSKSLQPFSAQHDWSSQVARSNLLCAVSQLVEPSNSCCTSKHSANDQLWMGCLTLGLLNAAVFVRPFQICQICNAVANAYGGLGQKISFFFSRNFPLAGYGLRPYSVYDLYYDRGCAQVVCQKGYFDIMSCLSFAAKLFNLKLIPTYLKYYEINIYIYIYDYYYYHHHFMIRMVHT